MQAQRTRTQTEAVGQRSGASRYHTIYSALRSAIQLGRLVPGQLLLEGPIAEVFGTSRIPVRKALKLLADDSLIRRFDGRGYLVGRPHGVLHKPVRLGLDPVLLGLNGQDGGIDHRMAGERIIAEMRQHIALGRIFGHYVVNEVAVAQDYGVSRTVVRETLMRLRDLGLVEKVPYSQWLTSPLTAVSVTDDYELRALLEPAALKKGVDRLERGELQAMIDRVDRLLARGLPPTSAELMQVEDDLHVQCLRFEKNGRVKTSLGQVQAPLTITQIFFDLVGTGPKEGMLSEHRTIYEFLLRGSFQAAAVCLEAHLQAAVRRTLERLKVLSVFSEPDLPAYLERLH
jgi:DNA-binding GntR family transcriptional regulator